MKRRSDKELSRDDEDHSSDGEECSSETTWKAANAEELATRRIVKARRTVKSSASGGEQPSNSGLFSGISLLAPAPVQPQEKPTTEEKSAVPVEDARPASEPKESALETKPEKEKEKEQSSPSLFSSNTEVKNPFTLSSTFTFAALATASAFSSSSSTSAPAATTESKVENIVPVFGVASAPATNTKPSEDVQVMTGEEDETTVFQITAKLFLFKDHAWVERGLGSLHLNTKDNLARLVMRTDGSHRLMLNSAMFVDMPIQPAGDKAVRITCQDLDGKMSTFSIKVHTKEDAQSLLAALQKYRPAKPASSS